MKSSAVEAAIERLATFFHTQQTRQGLLARAALGRSLPEDATQRARLIREMRAETRIDGSLGGAVMPTIWRAIELMDLGHQEDQAGTLRVVGWVLNLQGKPGAYGAGCSEARHRHRVCEHYIGGFFSAAPPSQRVSPVSMPNGKVFRAEAAARFAISCLALRAALKAGFEGRPLIQQHLVSLVMLRETWTDWSGYFTPDLIVSALQPLSLAPPPHRAVLPGLAAFVAEHQAEDGTWPNADLFHTLEALLMAGTPEAQAAVRRAMPALLALQRPDGSFGGTAQQERAWIGLRALRLG